MDSGISEVLASKTVLVSWRLLYLDVSFAVSLCELSATFFWHTGRVSSPHDSCIG
jgi:hypothetical protein